MRKNKLEFLMVWALILICLILTDNSHQFSLLGSFKPTVNEDCEKALVFSHSRLKTNGFCLPHLTIVSCKIQIVAGTNYRIKMKKNRKEFCIVLVWKKLDGSFLINDRRSSCFPRKVKKKNNSKDERIHSKKNHKTD